MLLSYHDFQRSFFCSLEFVCSIFFSQALPCAFKNVQFPLILQKCHLTLLCLTASSFHPQISEMNVFISCLLSFALHSFPNSLQFGFWPYFSAEIALLKVNSLHFVKSNGLFIHPNSHSIGTALQLDCKCQVCQPPTSPSLLGPLNPPLFFSLATASTSNSYSGSRGPKDSRSIVGLSDKSLFDTTSMVLVGVMLIPPWVKENKQGQSRLGTNLG